MDMAKAVASSLRSRRTVRIWHFRDSGLFIIGLAQGDDPISSMSGTNNPDTADAIADRLANQYDVEISRLDLPGRIEGEIDEQLSRR
jgi:hypothetical protein